MASLVFDIESNGLIHEGLSKVHCIAIKDIETGTNDLYDPQRIQEAVDRLNEADLVIGHNIIKYDIMALRHCGYDIRPKAVFDTMVASSLLCKVFANDGKLVAMGKMPANFLGRHSLKAWGYRLGIHKDESPLSWEEYTPLMGTYCKQDVEVTYAVYRALKTKTESYSKAFDIEQKVATIIAQQIYDGVGFDIEAACKLQGELRVAILQMERDLKPLFGPRYRPQGKPFTPKKSNAKMGYTAGCPMQHIRLTPFNPGSNDDIIFWFKKKYNWEPEAFTEKGNVKLDGDILADLPYPEAKQFCEYKDTSKILSFFEGANGWLKNYNHETKSIHGDVNPNGAISNRMTHNNPNLGQIPAHSALGARCRELFVPRGIDTVLLGIDADALELRVQGHYLHPYDNGEFSNAVHSGKKEDGTDIHSRNTKAAGLSSRDQGKTLIYAFNYGAGDGKLGLIVGGTAKEGAKIRKKFLKSNPALGTLIDLVKSKASSGKLTGIDGRPLYIRSQHSAFNTLLQGGGAVIMKYILVELDERLRESGMWYRFVLNVHDEFQLEVKKTDADTIGAIAEKAFIDAGNSLGIRIPITGSYSLGNNWRETH